MKNFIKNNLKVFVTLIISAILFTGIGVYAATQYYARDISFTPSAANQANGFDATNVEDALNQLYLKSNDNSSCSNSMIGTVWNYPYTGEEQIFVSPCKGIYRLETWGAQGGSYNSTYIGGYGGYSIGNLNINQAEKLYINVGGQGLSGIATTSKNYGEGGYNGGGSRAGYTCANCNYFSSSGGGATHIALVSGVLKDLERYKGIYNEEKGIYESSEILIVSGGGGGNGYSNGGWNINSTSIASGGGFIGLDGNKNSEHGGLGGQNSSNISFGAGYDCGNSGVCDGGGGGFFGGKYGTSGAGGGSGYIGNPSLINKTMYCYGCTESNEEATKTEKTTCVDDVPIEKCSKKGNGYARITLLSLS